jgi:hypothetical protein
MESIFAYEKYRSSRLLSTLRDKVAGQTSIPEKLLGANLTQFDTKRRIPASVWGAGNPSRAPQGAF